jgi:hypothetical protein
MKKIYQYTAAFAMVATSLMLNTACSENFFDGNDAENAVRVSSALVGTQAKTRAALNGSVFDADDNIAVSTAADGTAAATYTCGQSGTWTSAQPLAWGSTYPVTYYAAYPATATYSSFSLPTDQSGATANLSNATEKANYMTATTGALAAKPESKGISLAFTHRTAMIIVEIVAGEPATKARCLPPSSIRLPPTMQAAQLPRLPLPSRHAPRRPLPVRAKPNIRPW